MLLGGVGRGLDRVGERVTSSGSVSSASRWATASTRRFVSRTSRCLCARGASSAGSVGSYVVRGSGGSGMRRNVGRVATAPRTCSHSPPHDRARRSRSPQHPRVPVHALDRPDHRPLHVTSLRDGRIEGIRAVDGRVHLPARRVRPGDGRVAERGLRRGRPGGVVTTWAWVHRPTRSTRSTARSRGR